MKSLKNSMKKFALKSLDDMVISFYDKLSDPCYSIKRGDLDYQDIPEEYLKNIDQEILYKLIAIDQLLIEKLMDYTTGMNPNNLDPLIMKNKSFYLKELKKRINKINEIIELKSNDVRKNLKKLHKKIIYIKNGDEIDKPSLNSKYKETILFFNRFIEKMDDDFYLDIETKNIIFEIIEKLLEISEEQNRHRIERLKNLKVFFNFE
jgi:hypothetical protein